LTLQRRKKINDEHCRLSQGKQKHLIIFHTGPTQKSNLDFWSKAKNSPNKKIAQLPNTMAMR
jgi:hypothetical protein